MDRIDIAICLTVDCASVQADLVLSEIMRVLTHEGFNILAGRCVNE